MDQHELIAAITEKMADKQTVRGLFLAGSFGRDTADEWSDVDLIAVVPEGQERALADEMAHDAPADHAHRILE
jgi:predicted nucleotidyltransferase